MIALHCLQVAVTALACLGIVIHAGAWLDARLRAAFAPQLIPEMGVLVYVALAAVAIEAARKIAVAALLLAAALLVIA